MIGDNVITYGGTEHISVYPEGHQTWVAGSSCTECQALRGLRLERHGMAPLFTGIVKMRDREYTSTSVMEKQAIAQARANGIEPERA